MGKYIKDLNLFPDNSGSNPGNSFLGSGEYSTWQTQAETTKGRESKPVTSVEHHFNGWTMSSGTFNKIVDGIEKKVKPLNLDKPLIRRDEFATMKELQFYDLSTKLVIYQAGMDNLTARVLPNVSMDTLYSQLAEIEGREELGIWCHQQEPWGPFGGNDPANRDFYRSQFIYKVQVGFETKEYCGKPWMMEIFKLHEQRPSKNEDKMIWDTRLARIVEINLPFEKVLKWIGKDNYFFQVNIQGFRTNTENGDSAYSSDSIGSFDSKLGAGPFSDFANQTNIMVSELQARYLSEGY